MEAEWTVVPGDHLDLNAGSFAAVVVDVEMDESWVRNLFARSFQVEFVSGFDIVESVVTESEVESKKRAIERVGL